MIYITSKLANKNTIISNPPGRHMNRWNESENAFRSTGACQMQCSWGEMGRCPDEHCKGFAITNVFRTQALYIYKIFMKLDKQK